MINPKELRHGNKILSMLMVPVVETVVGVRRVGSGDLGVEVFNGGRVFSPELLAPILLTPVLLLSAGFEITTNDSQTLQPGEVDYRYRAAFPKGQRGFMVRQTREGYFLTVDDGEFEWEVIEITALHQLQNLYFCLTGKELEINLP